MHTLRKLLRGIKKEPMLPVAVAAAIISLFITPPSARLLRDIDWRTLATLFLMLTVLEGFKRENVFVPLLRLASRLRHQVSLGLFLVFSVFFTSMFVTNDVSLIIFVPITIILFRAAGKERYILPLLACENIAAVRGSLLTPFGSPQNLFIFGRSGVDAGGFILYMLPICAISGVLLFIFVLFLFRREPGGKTSIPEETFPAKLPTERRLYRVVYLVLFAAVLFMIVSRTGFWLWITAAVTAAVLIIDRKILLKCDYVLLVTFFCFFVFSSSVSANETVAAFLSKIVAGREYVCSIAVSQVISNVPAAIVLYPFAGNRGALLYGLDSAGLVTIIGSLASIINYRIYVREYPGQGGAFMKTFHAISIIFFLIVALPGYFISLKPM
ncbi:MAG: hypothetical protein IKR21_04490 [Oscillospiraceae bacterium]|nr:hypothetical protein [Oscillospiraceae bacterium]